MLLSPVLMHWLMVSDPAAFPYMHTYKLYISVMCRYLDFCSEPNLFSNIGKLCCLFVFLKLDLLTFLRGKHAAFVFSQLYFISPVLAGGFYL